ncbi:MAG: type glyceraldehyde-3-phosphate dehydrogenase, partial [Pseudomonadota bacterium]
RNVARAILERPDCGLELVSINDLADATANALLFKRDSVHGAFAGDVSVDGSDLIVNVKRIQVTAERDPANLPHAAYFIDIAL